MRAAVADTLLILGDSLSAGYNLPVETIWANRLNQRLSPILVVNASISGDTTAQGLARLSEQLIRHQPKWVLIELGANDGMQGFPVSDIQRNLVKIITQIQQKNAQPILMQIRVPPNYGRRYSDSFTAIYPALAQQYSIPLLPFFLEDVITKPEWMLADGIHPNQQAQPFITDWMVKNLLPLLK